MAKIVRTVVKVAAIAAAVALAIPSGGTSLLAAGLAISGTAALAIATGLSIASSLLAKKPKNPGIGQEQANRLLLSIDPRTPRKMVFGYTALATDVRDQELTSDQLYLHRFVVVASHKVGGIDQIWFDDKLAWTATGGAQGEFAGYLTVTPILEGSAANAINIGPRMGTTRRFTGCAYLHIRYRLKGTTNRVESPFAQSIPSRVTVIGQACPVYDPRLDSTVPGGSGPCRANDQTTWVWGASYRNPALQLATYLLGWRINGKLAVGKGIPANRFNWPAFITAANICDESVSFASGGSEPRYRSDGIASEGDDPRGVINAFKAAMNAELDDVDGKIRPLILRNDLATPVWTFDENDVLGEFTWQPYADLDASFNIVRGSYPDPSTTNLYQIIDYPQVGITTPDGIDRIDTFDLGFVQSARQAQALAATRLVRAQYGGTFRATMGPNAWRVQKGDIVAGNFAPSGFAGRKFRVAEIELREDGTVPMMLREENAAIYPPAGSDRPALNSVQPTPWDFSQSPIVEAINEIELTPGPQGPPGDDGAPGANGINGTDGYSIAPTSITAAIGALAGGAVKPGQFPITRQMFVFRGNTDLSDDAGTTYVFTGTGFSAGTGMGGTNNKVLTITGIAAASASGTIEAKRGGVTIGTARVALTRVEDGYGSIAQQDTTLTVNSTTSYLATEQGGPITSSVGPNGTVRVSVSHGYQTSSGSAALAGKAQFRATPGSGGWTDMAAETIDPTQATTSEASFLSFSATTPGPASATAWEFRYLNRRGTGGGTIINQPGGTQSLLVEWSGV